MPTIDVPAELFMSHNGVNVYYVYKDDQKDGVYKRTYFYSFSEYSTDNGDDASFDVRDLDCYAPVSDGQATDNDFAVIKHFIVEAINDGDLDTEIDASGQTLPDRFENFYSHDDCPALSGPNGQNLETMWSDTSPCTNNDKCPNCGAEIEPYQSNDLPAPEFVDTPIAPMQTIEVSDQEFNTILAALRLWQDREEFFSGGRVEALMDIATNIGNCEPLDYDGIDQLIERIN